MRRITIILFLLFMFFVSICCESKQKAREMRFQIEQQRIARNQKQLEEEFQQAAKFFPHMDPDFWREAFEKEVKKE